MFININNLLILIAGLIICYIFFNVFILENFVSTSEKITMYKAKQAEDLDIFVKKNATTLDDLIKKNASDLDIFLKKNASDLDIFLNKNATALDSFVKNNINYCSGKKNFDTIEYILKRKSPPDTAQIAKLRADLINNCIEISNFKKLQAEDLDKFKKLQAKDLNKYIAAETKKRPRRSRRRY